MFFSIDNGVSDNDSTDTHATHFVDFDKVEQTLSYPSLKKTWNDVKDTIKSIIE